MATNGSFNSPIRFAVKLRRYCRDSGFTIGDGIRRPRSYLRSSPVRQDPERRHARLPTITFLGRSVMGE